MSFFGKINLQHVWLEANPKMTDNANIALFINMATATTIDYIYCVLEKNMDYLALKEKVISWIANKVTKSTGPAPMDMGGVDDGGPAKQDDEENDAWLDPERGHYVQAMSSAKCWNRGKDGRLTK